MKRENSRSSRGQATINSDPVKAEVETVLSLIAHVDDNAARAAFASGAAEAGMVNQLSPFGSQLMAEDCLLLSFRRGLLWRSSSP